jgi:hypothetical protein
MAAACLFLAVSTPGQEEWPHEPFSQASLIQLIATPERFNDKLVATYGFLALPREHPVLWLHKEDRDNALWPNGIWLDPTPEMRRNPGERDEKYVAIIGVFHAFHSGVPGYNKIAGLSGGLTDIRRCAVWSDPAHPIGLNYNSRRG